jgi:hypothetical protein
VWRNVCQPQPPPALCAAFGFPLGGKAFQSLDWENPNRSQFGKDFFLPFQEQFCQLFIQRHDHASTRFSLRPLCRVPRFSEPAMSCPQNRSRPIGELTRRPKHWATVTINLKGCFRNGVSEQTCSTTQNTRALQSLRTVLHTHQSNGILPHFNEAPTLGFAGSKPHQPWQFRMLFLAWIVRECGSLCRL